MLIFLNILSYAIIFLNILKYAILKGKFEGFIGKKSNVFTNEEVFGRSTADKKFLFCKVSLTYFYRVI